MIEKMWIATYRDCVRIMLYILERETQGDPLAV